MASTVRVCSVDDVPAGEARRFAVDGRLVAVVNLGDEGFRAVDAICSHEHYYLDEGEVDVDLETDDRFPLAQRRLLRSAFEVANADGHAGKAHMS